MQAISHGRKLGREVLTAPPLILPLCCPSLLDGFGVEPIYKLACLIVERSK